MSDDEHWIPQPARMESGVLSRVDRVVSVIVIAGFSLMAIVIAIQVLARYIWNSPTVWSEELAISLFVWSTMLAIPLGLRRGEHLTLDVVSRYLSPRATRWLALAIALLTSGVFVILGYLTIGLLPAANRQLLAGIAGGLGVEAKVSWVYVAVPVGAVLAVLFTAERAIAFFRGRLDVLSADADQAVIDILESDMGGEHEADPSLLPHIDHDTASFADDAPDPRAERDDRKDA
jgi:TRAP-type C4-dicarboxylate transport system permease small subunit